MAVAVILGAAFERTLLGTFDRRLTDDLLTVAGAVTADGGGQARNEVTSSGATLVVVRWARIPAGGTVSATLRATVAANLPAGAVIDNLFAVRSANAAYTTGSLSVGMPPITLPDFR